MKKSDFISKLLFLIAKDEFRCRGQKTFANFLVVYLKKLDLSAHEKYDFWRIDQYVPQIMLDAFEKLRVGTEEYAVVARKIYEKETGVPVPNVTDIGESSSLSQCMAIQTTLGFLAKDVMGKDYIEQQIDSYFNAQRHVIQQYFDKFLRTVYRQSLYELIEKSSVNGMSGKFGETTLRVFSTAGRRLFTFARQKAEGEIDLTMIGEDSDPQLYSSGMQSVNANFVECLAMISDVIDYWPTTEENQKLIFTGNKHVTLDVIAALSAAE